jgi:hypothetical protein
VERIANVLHSGQLSNLPHRRSPPLAIQKNRVVLEKSIISKHKLTKPGDILPLGTPHPWWLCLIAEILLSIVLLVNATPV